MCNKYTLARPPADFDPFSILEAPIRWAEGAIPNAPAPEDYSIRDACPVLSRVGGQIEASLRKVLSP